jgi:hypothetical protein
VFVVVVATNVVVNVENVLDFQWFPSNLHIHPLQIVDVPPLWKPYVMFLLISMVLFP